MTDTIWVLREGQEEDDRDHSLILREEKSLKRLSKELGVKSLPEFFDYSILKEEFNGPDTEPNYSKPSEILPTLEALIIKIKSGESNIERSEELLEELEDCLKKVVEAEDEKCSVRLSIVP